MKSMKYVLFGALCGAAVFSQSLFAQEDTAVSQETKAPMVPAVRVALTLSDGSTLKGECKTEGLSVSTIFDDSLMLSIGLVSQYESAQGKSSAKVRLANGDELSVTMKTEVLYVVSMLGELNVPVANVRKATFSAGADEDLTGLVYYSTFDDAASICNPKVGPRGVVGNVMFVPGKVGNAVRIPRLGNAGVVDLPAGFLGETGCIEFWAKLEGGRDSYGDCDPRFFRILNARGNDDIQLEFSNNNGSGKGGLNCRLMGLGAVSGNSSGGHSYSDILGTGINEWHHYAISWNANRLTLYLDGRELDMAFRWGGRVRPESFFAQACQLGFPNTRDADGTHPRTAYLLDEFKIWNCERSSFPRDDWTSESKAPVDEADVLLWVSPGVPKKWMSPALRKVEAEGKLAVIEVATARQVNCYNGSGEMLGHERFSVIAVYDKRSGRFFSRWGYSSDLSVGGNDVELKFDSGNTRKYAEGMTASNHLAAFEIAEDMSSLTMIWGQGPGGLKSSQVHKATWPKIL